MERRFRSCGLNLLNDLQFHRVTADFIDGALKLFSFAIKDIYLVSHRQAQDVPQVARLVRREPQALKIGRKGYWRCVEPSTGHLTTQRHALFGRNKTTDFTISD